MPDPIRNSYTKNPGRALTPVYVPFESYSFVLNANLISFPHINDLKLEVWDADLKSSRSNGYDLPLQQVFPITGSALYQLFSIFPFPPLPNGEYRLVLHDHYNDRLAMVSGVILVERDVMDTTMRLEWWHETDFYGVYFEAMHAKLGGPFKHMVRLPLSRVDLQYESEKKTYRNISDRKLRTLQSYRDANAKIEARQFDDDALEALSAALEHDHITIDGVPIQPKTALAVQTNQISALQKATFDAYESPELRHGIFEQYGDQVIMCGDAYFSPSTIIQPQ